jgi:hypothetical protein
MYTHSLAATSATDHAYPILSDAGRDGRQGKGRWLCSLTSCQLQVGSTRDLGGGADFVVWGERGTESHTWRKQKQGVQ